MNTILTFLKKNWLVILLVVAVGLLSWRQFVSAGAYNGLIEAYNQQADDHEKYVKELKKINDSKDKEIEKLHKTYKLQIKTLEDRYEASLDNIKETSTERRKRIVKRAQEDPTSLTKEIERVFQIPVSR